jgi:hypothetical protein
MSAGVMDVAPSTSDRLVAMALAGIAEFRLLQGKVHCPGWA